MAHDTMKIGQCQGSAADSDSIIFHCTGDSVLFSDTLIKTASLSASRSPRKNVMLESSKSEQNTVDPGKDHGRVSGGAPDSRSPGRPGIVAALVLIGGYMIVEAVAGFFAGSLALLAHAGHMLTDAAFLVLALVAMRFSGRSTAEHTYGFHRTEIIAALSMRWRFGAFPSGYSSRRTAALR